MFSSLSTSFNIFFFEREIKKKVCMGVVMGKN